MEEAPTLRREVIAGVTTFLAMSYIVVVNPAILATEGTGMPFTGVLTATVIVSSLSTLLMGAYARLPFAVAPGMGLNAFFTFTLVLGQGIPWQTVLGIVFWSGVLFVILSVTPVRATIVRAIPPSLRAGMGGGIGLFLAFIGLRNGGIVTEHPVTLVGPGALDHRIVLFVTGLCATLWLMRRRSPFAFLAGIALVTLIAWGAGLVAPPSTVFSAPDVRSVLLQADLIGALRPALLPALVAFLLTDLFDSLSTLIGVSQASGLVTSEGEPRRMRQALTVDAFATLLSGLAGTSSGTAYIESATGISAGGRTGLTSVVTGLCFVPCLFVGPLVLVGSMMFRSATGRHFDGLEESVPAFLTMVLIPLSFSITQGILWGFISHVALSLILGRHRNLHPAMYALAVVSVGLLILDSAR